MARDEAEGGTSTDGRKSAGSFLEGMGRMLGNKYLLAVTLLLIMLIAVFVRSGMLRFQGLFEPDGFYYYSIIEQTVSNHFVVPGYSVLSGFPTSNTRGEQPGLVYLTVLPYMLLQYLGISYYTIMRLLPVVFSLIYILLTYLLAKQISNSRLLGVIAAFFVAVSSGNIARTAALVYRGDSFIAFPLMVAMLLMLQALKDDKHRLPYALLASLALSTGILIWTGSAFIIAVYMFALVLMAGYGFVTAKEDIVETNVMLTLGLFLTYMLEHLYVYIGATRIVSPLFGTDFLVFYVPLLVASLAALYLTRNKSKFSIVENPKKRIIVAIVVIIVAALIAFIPLTSYIVRIVEGTGAGSTNANNPVGATTQELQAPTFGFLFASFNMQLYLALIGVLLLLLVLLLTLWAYFTKRLPEGKQLITTSLVGGAIVALAYVAYLFMTAQSPVIGNVLLAVPIMLFAAYCVYACCEYVKSHSMTSGMVFASIIASTYLIVTAYMQSLAIRYNALLSIPLAIFSAYCMYMFWEFAKEEVIEKKWLITLTAAPIDAVMLYFLIIRWESTEVYSPNLIQAAGAALVIIAFAAGIAYTLYALLKGRMRVTYLLVAIFAAILIFNFYNTYLSTMSAAQADGINPLFLDAMTWMSQNTPKNSTVWAVWPDGSVVEGWANRTSYMDSVGGELAARIVASSDFLFNSSAEEQYLYSIGKPDYIVARSFWYSELGGLAVEGLVQNSSNYGYAPLNSLHIAQNGTQEIYSFDSTTPPYYKAVMVLQPGANGTNMISAYIGSGTDTKLSAIRNVMLYNQADYNYSIATSQVNGTLNYTLLVTYVNRNITGGAILGYSLPGSNLFKFTFLCNYYVCPYGNGNVSMRAVYINDDTRIFKIIYK